MPSSTATSVAHAVIGLVSEASRKRWSTAPTAPSTVPSARTTAAATRRDGPRRDQLEGPQRDRVSGVRRRSARRRGTPGRGSGGRSAGGRTSSRSGGRGRRRTRASAPPRHSVTFSPVSSTWMPPGHVPSARWARTKPAISRTMSSKWRVLRPLGALNVLPCIGSHAHTTGWPASVTARSSGRRRSSTWSAPMRLISVRRPGTRAGLSGSHSASSSAGSTVGPTLQPIGLPTPRRNSTWAPSRSRVRSPIHSMCAEQSYQSSGQRVLAGQRLLVAEDQRLVAGVDVDLAEVRVGLGVDAAGPHEVQGAVDLGGQPLVAAALRAGGDELLVPRVDPGEVGEAALGERPDQVQRRRRLVVRLHEPLGVGHPGGGVERRAVDDVAAERRQVDVALALGGAGAGLGELAGDAADLHDRARPSSTSAPPPSAG